MTQIRVATAADADRIIDLGTQAFNMPTSFRARAKSEFDPARYRLAVEGERIDGTVRLWPFAQFFGGNAVSACGIAGVAVAAEARGRGIGTLLMREALTELRAGGTALSTLYPATVPIYRQAGYGHGGVRTIWKLRLDDVPAGRAPAVETFSLEDAPALNEVYEAIAAETNGLIARTPEWWEKRVLTPWDDKPQYRYLVREDGRLTGWIAYTLEESKGGEWRATMSCRDLFWRTPGAARALLGLASLHRSTGYALQWVGPTTEPLADLLPEDKVELEGAFRYMVRLLDVPAALEARGYHPLLEVGVTIATRDPLFAENDGPWRIDVAGGRAKVTPTASADATADVQTWASIYTGLLRARDAVRLGALDATDAALDALEAIFAGPTPWIADFF